LTGQQILEAIDEPSYQRLEPPDCCPKEYYSLMLRCWAHDPTVRPKFAEIVSILPDCRPELVQAVKTSIESPIPTAGAKEVLPYKSGDIITVLDKSGSNLVVNNSSLSLGSNATSLSSAAGGHDSSAGTLWKGALNSGKTGYFNPSDCVSYLGQNLPTSSSQSLSTSTGSGGQSTASTLVSNAASHVLQSKFIRGFLDSRNSSHSSTQSQCSGQGSPYGSRRRIRPDMISRPQGDLVHTGHVGADGAFFGDVAFLDGKYNQLPKQIVAPYRAQDDQNHNHNGCPPPPPHKESTGYGAGGSGSGARHKWALNERKLNLKNASNSGDSSHEYHEISDEEDFAPLESPPFEILDFGPSLVEEVFRELDSIKPELNNDITDNELAINETTVNVKNEVREINLRINKEALQTSSKGKKQAMVKPISASDQMELDSAIAMAKDIATRSMLTLDNEMVDPNGRHNDSPKTPNSPNKKTNKFSFKFTSKSSPKTERRNFSEETESIGNIIESITPAAKEAYISLVDKGSGLSSTTTTGAAAAADHNLVTDNGATGDGDDDAVDGNPLRMLRSAGIGGVLRAKVRGNRSFSQPRLPTTAQTAGLARVASMNTRSSLGVPPPVPTSASTDEVDNALPLPPRDRSRPMLMQLKTHQRRYPLVMPVANGEQSEHAEEHRQLQQREGSPLRMLPVLKQVSCPQPPQSYLDNYSSMKLSTNDSMDGNCDKKLAPVPPPKPQRSYLGDESFESEMQKALDSIQMDSTSITSCSPPPPEEISTKSTQNHTNHTNNDTKSYSTTTHSSGDSMATKALHMPSKVTPIQTNSDSYSSSEHISSYKPMATTTTTDNHINSYRSSDITTNGSSGRTTAGTSYSSFESSIATKKKGVDSDEVRVMQKVLANETNLSSEECAKILHSTDWDVHKAIKCIRLRQQLRSHAIDVECDWAVMLAKFNWNIRQASNYLIATQGVPGDATEMLTPDKYQNRHFLDQMWRKFMKTFLKSHSRTQLLFRVLISLVCLSGFLYQANEIISQYMTGRTFVNIKIERLKERHLPAITVCAPGVLSWAAYMSTSSEFTNTSEPLADNSTTYYRYVNNIMHHKNISLDDFYNRLSISLANHSQGHHIREFDDHVVYDPSPVETILSNPVPKKCVAFFSDYNPYWKGLYTEQKVMDIRIEPDENWFPPGFNHYSLILHSPNDIPLYKVEYYQEIQIGYYHEFKYSEIETQLLRSHETCRDYGTHGEYKTRNDCVIDCLFGKLQESCGKLCFKFPFETLIFSRFFRRQHFDHQLIDDQCADYQDQWYRCSPDNLTLTYIDECHECCSRHCSDIIYVFNMEKKTKINTNSIHVQIRHGIQPDELIEHIPKMSFMSLVSSIGGLIGMWLGVSLLMVLDHVGTCIATYIRPKSDDSVV
ncbi:unnamed protein product, partial [Oppiella nova]